MKIGLIRDFNTDLAQEAIEKVRLFLLGGNWAQLKSCQPTRTIDFQ